MRVAIVGAGAIGGLFGARLALAGHEVWLVHHRAEMVDALRTEGLLLRDARGSHHTPVNATADTREVGPVDLAVVLVKSRQTREAAVATVPMVGEATAVLTIQNGLGNREILAEVVGGERVLAGMTYAGAAVLAPGHVRETAAGETVIGERDGLITERLERIASELSNAGLPTTTTRRLEDMIWAKLVINASLNATCAVTGASPGQLLASADGCNWLRTIAQEVASVARAAGRELPFPDAGERVIQHCRTIGASKPSMLQDVERGRWTEVDAINGAVVREGERLGVPTPYNRALTLLVKTIEARQHAD